MATQSNLKDDTPTYPWFEKWLLAMKHPDPSTLRPCFRHVAGDQEADHALHSLVLWLERYCICRWDICAQQDKLTIPFSYYVMPDPDKAADLEIPHVFAASTRLSQYLQDVSCPSEYVYGSSSRDTPDWFKDANRRACVIQWLCCLALNRHYNRHKANRLMDPAKMKDLIKFPPGFTTGDPIIDYAASAMRMKYLAHIRNRQDEMNECVRTLQQLSAWANAEDQRLRKKERIKQAATNK